MRMTEPISYFHKAKKHLTNKQLSSIYTARKIHEYSTIYENNPTAY